MSRRTYLFAALVIVLVGFAAPLMWTAARAQDDSAIPSDHPLIGTWRVTNTEDGESFPLISTWSSDGTLIGAEPPVLALGPDFTVLNTPTFGAWEATDDSSGAFTVELLASDAQGNFFGTLTVSGIWQASDDGQSVTGEYAYSGSDPTGTVVAFGQGTLEGTRLSVVPMDELATPVTTPAT